MNEPFFRASIRLLDEAGICVDKENFKKRLCTHRAYPSLRALTDVLSHLDISWRAVRTNPERIKAGGYPVMLHINSRRPWFIVVSKIENGQVTFFGRNLYRKKDTEENVFRFWDGTALYVYDKPTRNSLLCKLKNNRICYALAILFAAFFALVVPFFVFERFEYDFYLFFLLKLIGLLCSYLLIRHELGKTSSLEKHICSLTEDISCDAVLSSAASKLFGWIKMADIGIIYFSTGFLLLVGSLFAGTVGGIMNILGIMSLASFPYILFSLSYQKWEVKKWCPLCLGVIAVLLSEIMLIICRFIKYRPVVFSWENIYVSACIFVIVAAGWSLIYPLIAKAKNVDTNEINYRRLKHNSNLFKILLENRPAVPLDECPNDLRLGRSDVPLKITLAMKLTCRSCMEAYGLFFSVMRKNPDRIGINIRFMGRKEKDKLLEGFFIALYLNDRQAFIAAMDAWSKAEDNAFLERFGYTGFLPSDKVLAELERQLRWGDTVRITYTPTVFLNGKRVPSLYSPEEVVSMIVNG